MSDGPSYIVHQPDGTTFGPADVSMLREWVAAGIVTRTTALSIQGEGRRTPAAVVPGLFEPEQQGQATAQPAEPKYQAHLASGTTDALTLADLSRMVEAGEIVSTTPISLVGGSKRVPAAVVPGLEVAFREVALSKRTGGSSAVEALTESQVEGELPAEMETLDAPDRQAPVYQTAEVSEASGQTSTGNSHELTAVGNSHPNSRRGICMFFLWCLASTLVSLVICTCLMGYLTKIAFPVSGDVNRHLPHSSSGKVLYLVVLVVIFLAALVQRWGINFWSCFLVPALWLGFQTAVVWGKDSHNPGICRDSGLFSGLLLGYWFAAILSAIWFGPHPLAR